jgi:hypothetical protein
MMTTEQRREYMREWRKNNKDKIREQQRDNARRKALADLVSVKIQPVDVCIIRTTHGGEYRVGRPRQ